MTPDTAAQLLPPQFAGRWHPEPDTGCWTWDAATWWNGYGRIYLNGAGRRAHRVAYETLVATIPPKLVLDHICHNKRCINPAHLRPCTRAQNTRFSHTRTDNTSGEPGVHWCRTRRRWIVQVRHDTGRIRRSFTDRDEAIAYARTLRAQLHGDFAHERITDHAR